MTTHPTFPSVTQMLPEPKRMVLEALRSDRFKQRKYCLAEDDGEGMRHCCLGVFCEVAIEAGVPVDREERRTGVAGDVYLSYDGCTTIPPLSVMDWLYGADAMIGSPTVVISEPADDGSTDEVARVEELAILNDDKEWTFEQIAQAIEDSL